MSELPQDYKERVKHIQKIFLKLKKKNKNWNNAQIMRTISEQTGIPERTLRGYKIAWEETRAVQVNRIQIEKDKGVLKVIKPTDKIPHDKKREIITIICNELSRGDTMLTKILDEQGMTRYTFNEWINEDEEYLVMFNKATEMHNQSYGHRLDEAIRRMILVYVGEEVQQERTITYDFVPIINPENPDEIIYDKVPKSETIRFKPVRPEPIMVKQILESIREFKNALNDKENKDIAQLLAMNESQLEEQIRLLEAERIKQKPEA